MRNARLRLLIVTSAIALAAVPVARSWERALPSKGRPWSSDRDRSRGVGLDRTDAGRIFKGEAGR